jgi:hypothetical protein
VAIAVAASLSFGADTKVVEITGVGPSRDLAIKDGLRSAVEKAVGMLVTSETEVSNNTLIRDNILLATSTLTSIHPGGVFGMRKPRGMLT